MDGCVMVFVRDEDQVTEVMLLNLEEISSEEDTHATSSPQQHDASFLQV